MWSLLNGRAMFLPVEGWGRNFRAGANCADGCEWRDATVLVVYGWVFGLIRVGETGIDEVVAVRGEANWSREWTIRH